MNIRNIIKEHLYVLTEATAEEIYNKYYKGKLPKPSPRPYTDFTEEEVFKMIVQYDPFTEVKHNDDEFSIIHLGKYSKWLLNLFIKKKIKPEDLYKARQYLKIFDEKKTILKRDGKETDIMKYQSLPDLAIAIEPYEEKEGNNVTNTQLIKQIKEEETERFYEDDKWLVVIPKTERASCLYGKGTKWCTAAEESDNMFDYYSDDGPLYIIMDKENRRKYQMHVQSGQYVDEQDAACEINLPAKIFLKIIDHEYDSGARIEGDKLVCPALHLSNLFWTTKFFDLVFSGKQATVADYMWYVGAVTCETNNLLSLIEHRIKSKRQSVIEKHRKLVTLLKNGKMTCDTVLNGKKLFEQAIKRIMKSKIYKVYKYDYDAKEVVTDKRTFLEAMISSQIDKAGLSFNLFDILHEII